MKMNRNWQNRPQHTVIALLLYTSAVCNKSKQDTGQVKWTFATTVVQLLVCSQILNFKRQNLHQHLKVLHAQNMEKRWNALCPLTSPIMTEQEAKKPCNGKRCSVKSKKPTFRTTQCIPSLPISSHWQLTEVVAAILHNSHQLHSVSDSAKLSFCIPFKTTTVHTYV